MKLRDNAEAFLASDYFGEENGNTDFHIFSTEDGMMPASKTLCGKRMNTFGSVYKNVVLCEKCMGIAMKKGLLGEPAKWRKP